MTELNSKKQISNFEKLIIPRLYLLIEILVILIINVVIVFILNFIFGLDLSNVTNPIDVIKYYFIITLSIILSSIIGLLLNDLLFSSKERVPNHKIITPLHNVFSQFKVTRDNFKYQLMYTFLFLFLIYIPLDFLAYSIPGVIEFSINSLLDRSINQYLPFNNVIQFIGSVTIIYFCVGLREELFFRGVCVSNGRIRVGNYSSVVLISLFFGLAHFSYIITSPNLAADFIPALVWGITAFIIGIASALFIMKKRYILPLIISHSINNIFSTTVLWQYNTLGFSLLDIVIVSYLPLLSVSLISAMIFRTQVKTSLSIFHQLLPNYIKEIGETKKEVSIMIFTDIIFGLILWFFGLNLL